MPTTRLLVVATSLLVLSGCAAPDPVSAPVFDVLLARADDGQSVAVSPAVARAQVALHASGITNVTIGPVELRVAAGTWQGATTLLANDRARLFPIRFVENDPRRGAGASIRYLVDQSDGAVLSITPTQQLVVLDNGITEPVVDRSMAQWRTGTACRVLDFVKVADPGVDPDVFDGLTLGDASRVGFILADITHAGWLPGTFFDALLPNGSSFILGVTVPFVFIDANGIPTDMDRNGAADAAFFEIYYNANFPWTTLATNGNSVDIQSVVTHEAGHALGLAHFGKLFLDRQGNLKLAPLAIMNAGYVSAFRDLTGTDRSQFCNIWADRR